MQTTKEPKRKPNSLHLTKAAILAREFSTYTVGNDYVVPINPFSKDDRPVEWNRFELFRQCNIKVKAGVWPNIDTVQKECVDFIEVDVMRSYDTPIGIRVSYDSRLEAIYIGN